MNKTNKASQNPSGKQEEAFSAKQEQAFSTEREKALGEKQKKIAKLLENPAIWQATNNVADINSYSHFIQTNTKQGRVEQARVDTGYKSLNTALTQQGWPLGQLIECLTPNNTRGELALFLPAIQQLNLRSQRPIVLIAPPYIPNKAVWDSYMTHSSCTTKPNSTGKQQSNVESPTANVPLWFITTQNLQEQLWATEQTLQSGCASTVISWLNNEKLRSIELKKLQLASRQHPHSLSILMRSSDVQAQPSPATLRLCLEPYARPTPQKARANKAQGHAAYKASNKTASEQPIKSPSPASNPLAHKYRPLHAARPDSNQKEATATPPTDLAITIIKQAGSWQRKKILIPWHRQLQRPSMPVSQWPYHQIGQAQAATIPKRKPSSIAVSNAKHTDV